jgi:hypothetical protein
VANIARATPSSSPHRLSEVTRANELGDRPEQLLAVGALGHRLDEQLGQAHSQCLRERGQRLDVRHAFAALDHREKRDADLRPLGEVLLGPAILPLGAEVTNSTTDALADVGHDGASRSLENL